MEIAPAAKEKTMVAKKTDKKTPAYLKGKYTETKDKKKDAVMTKVLTPAEKREFEKKDKAHGAKKKPSTMKEDKKIDAKIIKGIKAKRKK